MKALFSATGMAAQQIQIDTIANNLANVSTTGFKKVRVAFEDLVYEHSNGELCRLQAARAVEVGSGSRVIATQRDFTPGSITQTNSELDVLSVRFFVVQTPDGVDVTRALLAQTRPSW